MKVVVNKVVLEDAIKKIIESKRSIHSTAIDTIVGKDVDGYDESEEPIEASDLMSVQLATERPAVEDPEFVPANSIELSRAASVISDEVPDDQIDFFYRKLHDLLDQVLDREEASEWDEREPTLGTEAEEAEEVKDEQTTEQEDTIRESNLRKAISLLIEQESDEKFTQNEQDDIQAAVEEIENYLESINFGHSTREKILDDGEISTPFSEALMKLALDDMIGPKSVDPDIQSALRGLSARAQETATSRVRSYYMKVARKIPTNQDMAQLAANKEVDMVAKSMLGTMSSEDVVEELIKRSKLENDELKKNAYINIANLLIKKGKAALADASDYDYEAEVPVLSDEDAQKVEQERLDRDLKKLDALASVYGFSAASGFRQWRMKFPNAIFKVVLGSEGGVSEYSGFSNEVYRNMMIALKKISEMVALLSESLEDEADEDPDNKDVAKMLETLQQIDIDLLEIQETATPDGDFDVDKVLNTLGGKVLRQIFSNYFYKPPFTEYARVIKKYMIDFLIGKGIDPKTASTFAKMFNGEVDLLPHSSDKKQMSKVRNGGVTKEIYRDSLSAAQQFNKMFFGKEKREEVSAKFEKSLRDPQKMSKAIFEAIPTVIDWAEIEVKNPQLRVDKVDENKIRHIISGIIS